jgi:hypothetical protein
MARAEFILGPRAARIRGRATERMKSAGHASTCGDARRIIVTLSKDGASF